MTTPLPAAHAHRPLRAAGLAGALLLGLTACGQGEAPTGEASSDALSVVTTTSVWADVVREVGGDAVVVDPVIDSTAQDPHSYEATAQDRLAVRDADLVVLNGGGYDAFMEDLAAQGDAPVVNAVEASGLEAATGEPAEEPAGETQPAGEDEHDHGGLNEHVWYDLGSTDEVARAIADRLAELDPDGADAYGANAEAFAGELAALERRLAEAPADGAAFVATEPVAVRLLEDAGLHDDTPTEFTAAIEGGTDVPPLVLRDIRREIADGHVQLLAFNAQTASGQTEQLRDDAREAGAAVVEFTETLPEGTSYLEWMDGNVDRVLEALGTLPPRSSGTAAE
ncbi:metal ABC transporter substrate-binding protein [Kocuria dechangensis]|uniref:Metal ABC transporter substrate-binding protein n=1 Tax=Kocuria dechangensis TaxID=1176249 RepID=A0A917GV87_9MICC|nr:zinc ABC transporter substrate-binding protein [Kocuria dechangensis]GGG57865.1 metal ABC transporter substrate-binding protein [Kocuria dechangensis]